MLYSFWPFRTFIASTAPGITSPPLMSTPSISKANANLSVVGMPPSSGVVAADESCSESTGDGDESLECCSAKCSFASSMACATACASLGLSRCFGGATIVGPPAKRSSLFALMEESRLGVTLAEAERRPRGRLLPVSFVVSKLLETSWRLAAILKCARRGIAVSCSFDIQAATSDERYFRSVCVVRMEAERNTKSSYMWLKWCKGKLNDQ